QTAPGEGRGDGGGGWARLLDRGARGRGRLRGGGLGGGHRSQCRGLALLDPVEIKTGRRLFRNESERLEERLPSRVPIARLEALSAALQEFREAARLFGHFLPSPLDARHGLPVVDVDQEDAGPDLDGLVPVPARLRFVPLLDERLDLTLASLLLLRGTRRRKQGRRDGFERSVAGAA